MTRRTTAMRRRRRMKTKRRKFQEKMTTWTRKEDSGWHYRDTDLASRDIRSSQRMAICLDEPREAQYMAGFIALQMSKMWGMFGVNRQRGQVETADNQENVIQIRATTWHRRPEAVQKAFFEYWAQFWESEAPQMSHQTGRSPQLAALHSMASSR